MKNKIGIDQISSDLKLLFQISENGEFASYENKNIFNIDKRQFNRLQVIEMLQEYFKDKVIIGGYLIVDPITFVFTTFRICEGVPPKATN